MTAAPGRHREQCERLFPGLAIATFEPLGGGWDCWTYVVNGDLVVQFPRLPGAVDTLRMQLRLLPELAREVSAPIPHPLPTSEDDPLCLAYRYLEGRPMAEGGDGIWPERLGRFLYDLHLVPPEFVGMRGRSAEDVRAILRRDLAAARARVHPLLGAEERGRVDEMLSAFLDDDANFRFAPCLHHGDVGPPHVLVSEAGDLAGVIDWGDADVGDPAGDIAWILHAMPEIGERVLAAYGGEPDSRFRARARFAYALMPWHDITYGLDTDQPAFIDEGLAGLRARLV